MTSSSSRVPLPPAADVPNGSAPAEPYGTFRARFQPDEPDDPGEGAWLVVRLIAGFAIGLGLLHLAAHFGVPPAVAVLRSSGITDGVAVVLGLVLIEAAVHTPWGGASARAVRAFARRHRSTTTLVRYR